MNIKSRISVLILVAAAVLTFTNGMNAQEPQTPAEPPKPAGRGIPAMDETTNQDENSTQDSVAEWNADTMPITGLQALTIGNLQLRHSYLVPGFQYASTIQDQPVNGGYPTGWYANNFFGANLSLLQQWSRSQLALNYSGGGFVTTQPGEGDSWYQQLALAQTYTGRRWQMQILDQFAYLPESQFGFGAGTGLGLPGISGPLGPSIPGISGSVVPNQTIYAATGPQYSNSFVTQITYQISRRGSITMAGAYGLLRFTQEGNVDSNSYTGRIGYNYALTKEDSIGLLYQFTAYHYLSEPQAFGDQMINAVYGRKVTKRLALQIYGGLEITNYRIPVGNQSQTVGGDGGLNLTYAFRRETVSGNYFHGITGGSGILIGSSTDQVNLSATRRITRIWSVQGNFGFAKNRPLANGVGAQGSDYNSIFAGGGLNRPIGRDLIFAVAYQAQILQENANICTSSGCNTSHTQNVVTVSLQWHPRPFVLE